MKKTVIVIACVSALLLAVSAEAALQLPNYAAGQDVTNQVQQQGKKITDLISMIVAILAIIGIIIGGGHFAVGKGEEGKKYLFGGVIGLILAGAAYGIASLVA